MTTDQPNPFDAIPLDVQQNVEQFYAYAKSMLVKVVDAQRLDIEQRIERFGVQDDSVQFKVEIDRMMRRIVSSPAGPGIVSMICAAAIFELARAPRAEDQLEAQFKIEGTQP